MRTWSNSLPTVASYYMLYDSTFTDNKAPELVYKLLPTVCMYD